MNSQANQKPLVTVKVDVCEPVHDEEVVFFSTFAQRDMVTTFDLCPRLEPERGVHLIDLLMMVNIGYLKVVVG